MAVVVSQVADVLNGLWRSLEDEAADASVRELATYIQPSKYNSVRGLDQLYRQIASGEGRIPLPVAPVTSAELTDEAACYAKDVGLTATVEQVAQIVTRLFGQQRPKVSLTPVREEGDVPLLCFEISATDTTEQVLDQDEALQEELFDRLSPQERSVFSFLYRQC